MIGYGGCESASMAWSRPDFGPRNTMDPVDPSLRYTGAERRPTPITAWGLERVITSLRAVEHQAVDAAVRKDRKSTRLNSSHSQISYAVFCLKKKKKQHQQPNLNRIPRSN